LTRFKTTPDTPTVAPTAKTSESRAVCKSVALLKTVCIAVSPNVSNFGFFISSYLSKNPLFFTL
jgi:hypothetical protein